LREELGEWMIDEQGINSKKKKGRRNDDDEEEEEEEEDEEVEEGGVMRDAKREEGAAYGVLGTILALILVNGKVLGDGQSFSLPSPSPNSQILTREEFHAILRSIDFLLTTFELVSFYSHPTLSLITSSNLPNPLRLLDQTNSTTIPRAFENCRCKLKHSNSRRRRRSGSISSTFENSTCYRRGSSRIG